MSSRSLKSTLSETHTRTVLKAVSWRVIATLTTMTIVFVFTKEVTTSITVGFFEVISKMLFYYLHERGWGKVAWGRKTHPLAVLPVTKDIEPEDMKKIENQLRDLGYLD